LKALQIDRTFLWWIGYPAASRLVNVAHRLF